MMTRGIETKIEAIINDSIRPQLKEHFGDISFINYKDRIVRICFQGACKGCPSANTTLENVVRKALASEIDEIQDVIAVNEVSDDLMNMAKQILNKSKRH